MSVARKKTVAFGTRERIDSGWHVVRGCWSASVYEINAAVFVLSADGNCLNVFDKSVKNCAMLDPAYRDTPT